jgi:tetraacyldisaccharide 4'-kinase
VDAIHAAVADGPGEAMNPLSALFGAGIAARNRLYDRGMLQPRTLQHPVISIGNLSVGGAGKTPFVVLLGRFLQANHIAFDILSRGYGRSDRAIRLVDAYGSAELYGDEPLLLTRALQVPVIVGADRFAAGVHAEKLFSEVRPAHGRWVHLLDDGFQHRRLARQLDIVLLSQTDLGDQLLPIGRLREPLTAIRRADIIVLTDDTSVDALRAFGGDKPVWRVRRTFALSEPAAAKAVAFCGVARPQRFFDDLRSLGIQVLTTKVFPDHHRYSMRDINALLDMKRGSGADIFITTTKDLVNLSSAKLLLKLGKVITLDLRMEFVSPDQATILQTVTDLITEAR